MDINVDFHTAVFKLHQILTDYISYLNSPGWNKAYTFKTIKHDYIANDDNIKNILNDVIETLDKEIKENYKYLQIKKEHPNDEIMSEYSTFFNIYLIYRSILSMQHDNHITNIITAQQFFTYVVNYIGQNSVIDILWGHIWKEIIPPVNITNELLICRNILNLHMIKSIVSFFGDNDFTPSIMDYLNKIVSDLSEIEIYEHNNGAILTLEYNDIKGKLIYIQYNVIFRLLNEMIIKVINDIVIQNAKENAKEHSSDREKIIGKNEQLQMDRVQV